MSARWFGCVVAALLGLTVRGADGLQIEIVSDQAGHVQVTWPSIPGEVYAVETSTNLAQPWQRMEGGQSLVTATFNALSLVTEASETTRYFRVLFIDTHAPAIVRTDPIMGAIAVPPDSALQVWLEESSGIDTNSVTLLLGGNSPITLADPRLILGNNLLTFTPAEGAALGQAGQTQTVALVMADLLGNWQTNVWTFQLATPAKANPEVIVLGGAIGPSHRSIAAPPLALVTRSGDLFGYRYTGASSGLSVGRHLVDATRGQSYARTVLQLADDPGTKTVFVTTEPASLANLIEEGSLSSAIMADAQAGAARIASWSAGKDLDFSHEVDLSRVMYEDSNPQAYVKIELLPGSKLDLDAYMGFAANFRYLSLKEFEAYMGGSFDLRVEVLAQAAFGHRWTGTVPLLQEPIRKFYLAQIGPVPVEVETELTFDLHYDAEVQTKGHLQAGLTEHKAFFVGRRWEDGAWRDISKYPPLEFGRLGPDWQVEGQAAARVEVVPCLTIYLYGLAATWGEVDPYAEFSGQFKVNPWQYDWTLYGGVDASLGSDFRLIDKLFPDINFTKTYTLIPKTVILHEDNLAKRPVITLPPQSLTRNAGQSAVFGVCATGTAPLTYRWQKDGADLSDGGRISGSGGVRLVINQVQLGDVGDYRVHVSNSAGSATSESARLKFGQGGGPVPAGMVLIPAGTFQMGNSFGGEGWSDELPVHAVTVSAFSMDQTEVTWARWREVREWGALHGYDLAGAGGGKADNHPVHSVNWYQVVKWCNARSEKEGRTPAYYTSDTKNSATVYRTGPISVQSDWVDWNAGYRLPTEAEWEYAARGGASGRRFPWGDMITHSQANYYSATTYAYDVSSTRGYHPTYTTGDYPYTSPAGRFSPNGFDLYDMAGSVWEWCWDWSGSYSANAQTNPLGRVSGSYRVMRGGSWYNHAVVCRSAYRYRECPDLVFYSFGFRTVLPSGQ